MSLTAGLLVATLLLIVCFLLVLRLSSKGGGMPSHWVPEYITEELNELTDIKTTLLNNDKTVNLLLQVSQQNNILLARINRLPGVPVTMHIQFQGQTVDQPGVETDVQIITASAVEMDVFDKPTALDV